MGVAEKLTELEKLSSGFLASIRKEPRQAGDRVMAMREEFNELCTAIVEEMAKDPRIAYNREVFEAMQSALDAVRRRTFTHQLQWNASRIEQDPAGYFAAAQPLHDVLREFVVNARVFLRD